MTRQSGDVHTVHTREVHRGQCLTVDLRIGDQDTLRYEGLVLLFEVDVELRTDKGHDGLLVSLGTHDEHLVAHVEDGITVRDTQFTLMYQTRDDEVAVQEVMHLQQCLAFQILVRHLQVHLIGLLVGLALFHGHELFFLFLQLDVTYIPY